MKLVRSAAASVLALMLSAGTARAAEEEATCAQQYLLCLNEASQQETEWGRTWAEQRCMTGWFGCLRRQAFGA